MQQSSTKKMKHTAVLKNIHQEQLSKLQQKTQQETDLLDDIRQFSKQRSAIEKEYGQAMAKLAQQYLSKHKLPPAPNLPSNDGQEHKRAQGRMVHIVWKSLLEMTEALGKHRLEAAETYLTKVSEPCKPIYMSKKQISKKVLDQASVLHKEISQSVLDMTKSQKEYSDTEHVTHEVRLKAIEAEGKYKNKSTSIFTSLATLQKNNAKLQAKRETHEIKSTACRNQYMLDLVTANAHQQRFYQTDMANLLKLLDCDMNDRLREFLIIFSNTELHCSGFTQECFTKVMSDASLISEGYNLQCFLHDNPCFTNLIQYQFEAQDGDEVQSVQIEHGGKDAMEREAEKCAMSLAGDLLVIRQNKKQLHVLLKEMKHKKLTQSSNGSSSPPDKGPASPSLDPEVKLDEYRQNIRRAETNKCKTEARLEALRAAGVDVDDFIERAEVDFSEGDDYDITDPPSPVKPAPTKTPLTNKPSVKGMGGSAATTNARASVSQSDASSGVKSRTASVVDDTQTNSSVANNRQSITTDNNDTYVNYEEDDYMDDTFPDDTAASQPAQQSGDNTSVGRHGSLPQHGSIDTQSVGYCSGKNYPIKCTVLYDFQGTNADELTVQEGEQLELTADGDGDGWVKAHNSRGQIGFVPENYIQLIEDTQSNHIEDVDRTSAGGYSSTDPQSAGYNSSVFDSAPPSAAYDQTSFPPPAGDHHQPAAPGGSTTTNSSGGGGGGSIYSNTDYEVQETTAGQPDRPTLTLSEVNSNWVRALYEYEATADEELSFCEGQMIEIVDKREDIDDGWWKGRCDGREGVFPSLMVEELGAETHSMLTPAGGGPPAFTPPEPGPAPPHLEITQPTPSVENLSNSDDPDKPNVPLYGNVGEGGGDADNAPASEEKEKCEEEKSAGGEGSGEEDEPLPPPLPATTDEEGDTGEGEGGDDLPPPPPPPEEDEGNAPETTSDTDDLPPPEDDMIPPPPVQEEPAAASGEGSCEVKDKENADNAADAEVVQLTDRNNADYDEESNM